MTEERFLCKNSYQEVQDQTEQANHSEINMMQKNTDTYPRKLPSKDALFTQHPHCTCVLHTQ